MFVTASSATYLPDAIQASYVHNYSNVYKMTEGYYVQRKKRTLHFKLQRKPRKIGLMLVGWGGNNGTTLTAALTKRDTIWLGSITQAASTWLGHDGITDEDVFASMKDLVPFAHEIIVDGWDINRMPIGDAMRRAGVLSAVVQAQVYNELQKMHPRASAFDPSFVATNQAERVNNVIEGNKQQQYEQIRQDIREVKEKCDVVIVFWTANTERQSQLQTDDLETAFDEAELSPSTLFGMAAMREQCIFINGSPQNTIDNALQAMAKKYGGHLVGSDLKTGQTKLKTCLIEFLVNAGIRPRSIVSYNHLGNNDGRNLAEQPQLESKQLSKGNVITDIIQSNPLFDKQPDHCVVIRYVPFANDNKRAMDEYVSELMLGGEHTMVIYNICQDSLLAAPVMLDLILLSELFTRLTINNRKFPAILNMLNYLLKSPVNTPTFNALSRQRSTVDNLLRAIIGLPPISNMYFEA
jgi:myo-inositol-1-phosphate synthase